MITKVRRRRTIVEQLFHTVACANAREASTNPLTVLHYDPDFEVAATVLEFEHRWVAARGVL
jgi:hypothetical protein